MERELPSRPLDSDGAWLEYPHFQPLGAACYNVSMKIRLTSVLVDDQDKALRFYTEILGFVKKADFPVGKYRWITVVSPEGPDDVELALEPNENPVAKAFQEGLRNQGIPLTAFFVDDIRGEYERLKSLGVRFVMEPTQVGQQTIAMFDDTCGNLIQLVQA